MAQAPVAVKRDQLRFYPYGDGAELAPALPEGGKYPLASLGAGLVKCSAGHEFSWECPNDEAIYLLKGRAEISGGGQTAVAEAGEFIYLPKGVELSYAFPEDSEVVWVAHPRAVVEKAVEGLIAGAAH